MRGRRAGAILVVATQGTDSGDWARIQALTAALEPDYWEFDRRRKKVAYRLLVDPPRLLVIEGTGLGACVPAIVGRAVRGVPFVVSSGDAVGPFFRLSGRAAGAFGAVYERVLCRVSAGYIAWSPYLAGRALTFGAPRAITAEHWAAAGFSEESRLRIRSELGISPATVVFGIVGSITWSASRSYCYGLELVRALRLVDRSDVRVLVVGDGDGLPVLAREAKRDDRVLFAGRVPRELVPDYLSAMDFASLPQSRDGVGVYRYTTKLSEYLAAGLPIVTGRLPFAYDLAPAKIVRVPGSQPWGDDYARAVAGVMSEARISPDRNDARRGMFDLDAQRDRVQDFLRDVIAEVAPRTTLSRRRAPVVRRARRPKRGQHRGG